MLMNNVKSLFMGGEKFQRTYVGKSFKCEHYTPYRSLDINNSVANLPLLQQGTYKIEGTIELSGLLYYAFTALDLKNNPVGNSFIRASDVELVENGGVIKGLLTHIYQAFSAIATRMVVSL